MLIISFSQYEWIDSLTDIPGKINDIFTPFIVISNSYITDVLIKEVLTDSPLLIIKENINCGNFLNKDRFNFLTDRVNHKSLIDFPQTIIVVGERLYEEALFHTFSQNEIYKTDRLMADFVKFLNSCHSGINRLHHGYSYTTTQWEHKDIKKEFCFIIYALNFKNYFLIKHFKGILQKDIDREVFKMNFKEALQRNVYFQNFVYFQDIVSGHNDIPTNPFTKSQL